MLAEVERQLATAGRNMALAETEERRLATAAVFDELQSRRRAPAAELAVTNGLRPRASDPRAEVAAALNRARQLTDLAADGDNYVAVGELFRAVNIQLYVRFREEPWGKRVVRRVAGGVITLGRGGMAHRAIQPARTDLG